MTRGRSRVEVFRPPLFPPCPEHHQPPALGVNFQAELFFCLSFPAVTLLFPVLFRSPRKSLEVLLPPHRHPLTRPPTYFSQNLFSGWVCWVPPKKQKQNPHTCRGSQGQNKQDEEKNPSPPVFEVSIVHSLPETSPRELKNW